MVRPPERRFGAAGHHRGRGAEYLAGECGHGRRRCSRGSGPFPDRAALLTVHHRRGRPTRPARRTGPTGNLDPDDVEALIDRWISRASRSRLTPFLKAAKTIRRHRDGILTAIHLNINNGRTEGLNNVVRLITRRAYGFLALVMLNCGPIELSLPHERSIDYRSSPDGRDWGLAWYLVRF